MVHYPVSPLISSVNQTRLPTLSEDCFFFPGRNQIRSNSTMNLRDALVALICYNRPERERHFFKAQICLKYHPQRFWLHGCESAAVRKLWVVSNVPTNMGTAEVTLVKCLAEHPASRCCSETWVHLSSGFSSPTTLTSAQTQRLLFSPKLSPVVHTMEIPLPSEFRVVELLSFSR